MKTKAKAKQTGKGPRKTGGSSDRPASQVSRTRVTADAPGTARSRTTLGAQPLADRVLLRRLEGKETSAGGIVIPDTAQEKSQQAEVVAVGPGRLTKDGRRIASELRKGDRVLIGKYSGTDVRIAHDDFVIVREDEVFATLGR